MAGTLTRLQMANELLDNLGRSSTGKTRSGATLANRAVTWLDRAQIWVARKEDFLFKISTANTTADQKDYAMPEDIKALYSLRLEDGLSSRKLKVIMPWEFDELVPKPDEATTGRPDWYIPYKTTNTFELFKIPDTAYTMRLRYSHWPAALASDSQTSDFTNMDDVLIEYGTHLGFKWLQELNDAASWKKQARESFAEAALCERKAFPDWVPVARGFSTKPRPPIGEYWNDPFIERNPT